MTQHSEGSQNRPPERSIELLRALGAAETTELGVEGYAETLGLPRDPQAIVDLLGDKILDIGSGHRGFARDMESSDAEVEVVSLNPQLIDEDTRRAVEMYDTVYELSGPSVAGLVEALPFKDETFTGAVSSWGFPLVHDQDRAMGDEPDGAELQGTYKAGYQEVARVLKPGGNAILGPVIDPVYNERIASEVEGLEIDMRSNGRLHAPYVIRLHKHDSGEAEQ